MDEFLKAAGFPWVVRKAASKFGGSAVDLIAHSGPVMRVTSLNAKGSWSRTYDTEREVTQRNAEGTTCRTTSWWEGECRGGRVGLWGGRSLFVGCRWTSCHCRCFYTCFTHPSMSLLLVSAVAVSDRC